MAHHRATIRSLVFIAALLASATVAGASANSTTASTAPPPAHKTLTPLSGTDVGLFLVIAVALFISSGAGVGGGVLVVPALLVISRFSAIAAVALSNVTILASAVANLLFNVPRKSPLRAGPLIDWDLVLLFGPPSVAGSIAGSYVNLVVPSWVTKVCLFALLIPMAWRMVDKARSLYKLESAAKGAAKAAQPLVTLQPDQLDEPHDSVARDCSQQQLAVEPVTNSSSSALPPNNAVSVCADSSWAASGSAQHNTEAVQMQTRSDVETGCVEPKHNTAVSMHTPAAAAAAAAATAPSCWHLAHSTEFACQSADAATCKAVQDRLAREQARMLPPFQVGLLVLLLAVVALASLLAGYLLTCGSWQYWLLVLSPLPVMLLVWAVARHHVLWKAAWTRHLEMPDAGASLNWSARTTVIYPAICISAGVIAGLLGLGGGLVLAPLMLELGVQPSVAAASTQVTLLISSSTSAIVYAVNGAVPATYWPPLVVIGFLSTLLGQLTVSWLVKRLGRPSILVVTLAVMFSAATFAAAAVVVLALIDISQHPEKWAARKGVCPT